MKNSKLCVGVSVFLIITIIVFSGCATQHKAKKLVVIEQPKPVLIPEPTPVPPPPSPPQEPIVVPPPKPQPEIVITPPSPPPPPKPVKPAPQPKKPVTPLQYGIVKTPPISILGKKVTTVDVMSAPGVQNPVIAKVNDGTRVQLLGKSANNWYRIKLPDGTLGWISGNFLIVAKKASP